MVYSFLEFINYISTYTLNIVNWQQRKKIKYKKKMEYAKISLFSNKFRIKLILQLAYKNRNCYKVKCFIEVLINRSL